MLCDPKDSHGLGVGPASLSPGCIIPGQLSSARHLWDLPAEKELRGWDSRKSSLMSAGSLPHVISAFLEST